MYGRHRKQPLAPTRHQCRAAQAFAPVKPRFAFVFAYIAVQHSLACKVCFNSECYWYGIVTTLPHQVGMGFTTASYTLKAARLLGSV